MYNTQELIHSVWPDWQIAERLGQGSFGTVFKAVRQEAGVTFESAIKVISIPSDQSQLDALRAEGMDEVSTRTYLESIVKDCTNEIQVMTKLANAPHIVAIQDYKVMEKQNSVGWTILIRMEVLTPLTKYFESKRMDESELIRLGMDMCEALRICSSRNVIHRDIKPQNVFKDQYGSFKLGDFGIARKIEVTSNGMSHKGTSNYMAPEVYNGQDYDGRADICSLGIMLYQLANGLKLPFIDQTEDMYDYKERMNALQKRMRGENLPPLSGVSANLASIIMKACAFDPDDRYQNAESMLKDLERERLRMEELTKEPDPFAGEATEILAVHEAVHEPDNGGGTAVIPQMPSTDGVDPPGKKPKSRILIPIGIIGGTAALIAVVVAVVTMVTNSGVKSLQVVQSDELYIPKAVVASGLSANEDESAEKEAGEVVQGLQGLSEIDAPPTKDADSAGSNASEQNKNAENTASAKTDPEEIRLTGISVKKLPDEKSGFVGDKVSATDMVLSLLYSDKSEKTVTEGFTVKPEYLSAAGSQQITVQYGDFTTSYSIDVKDVEPTKIEVNSAPAKSSYFLGEKIDTKGLKLNVTYNNGKIQTVTDGFVCKPEVLSEVTDKQTVSISWGGMETTFSVTVKDVLPNKIELSSPPEKTSYYIGEKIDTKGLKLKVTYNNGKIQTITDGFVCKPEVLSEITDKQIVSISWGGMETICTVKVYGAGKILSDVNLTGKTESEAKQLLGKYNLIVSTEKEAADGAHSGKVLYSEATSDFSVTLFIGEKTEFVTEEKNGKIIIKGISSKTDFLNIPNKVNGLVVTEIADYAFDESDSNGDFGLRKVKFPSGLVKIGEGAFSNCQYLQEVILPDLIEEIGDGAFWNCSALTAVSFGKVKEIGDFAFQYCIGITKIDIPDTCKKIGEEAFSGSWGLKEIILPASLSEIGPGAFTGCSRANFSYPSDSYAEAYLSDTGIGG